MSDVTGPISTLAGSVHALPDGTKCDDHPDRPASARVQGETDSFGSEMLDLCDECLGRLRAYTNSPEARTGQCEWCKTEATDLRDARDYDEGMAGPVYRVCGKCRKRQSDEAAAELAERADDDDRYYDDD